MELGNFSVSLAVKDLAASRGFYEKLGLEAIGGDVSQVDIHHMADTPGINAGA